MINRARTPTAQPHSQAAPFPKRHLLQARTRGTVMPVSHDGIIQQYCLAAACNSFTSVKSNAGRACRMSDGMNRQVSMLLFANVACHVWRPGMPDGSRMLGPCMQNAHKYPAVCARQYHFCGMHQACDRPGPATPMYRHMPPAHH